MDHDLKQRLRQTLPPEMVADFDTLVRQLTDPAQTMQSSLEDGPPDQNMDSLELVEGGRSVGQRWLGTSQRYTDLGLLGEGGMGEVRLVRDHDLGRTMAMKIVRSEVMSRPQLLARFIEEAQCSAQLQHPCIVPVHELGSLPDGRLYFTMAQVRGRTLSDVIAEVHRSSSADTWRPGVTGWTFRGLVDVLHRVSGAVAYAHRRGVLHRDLKPDNVMVGKHGEVLVVDWGLAKVMGRPDLAAEAGEMEPVLTVRSQDTGQATRMGAVAGTPAYMPPEQARGAVGQINERSDVYSLGAILYEILSGRPPYEGTSSLAVVAKVRTGPPAPPGPSVQHAQPQPSGFDDNINLIPEYTPSRLPRELEAACNRAMAREPEERFSDAGELAAELGAWLEGVRRREQALEVASRAQSYSRKISELHVRAERLESEAAMLLKGVESWQPEEDKHAGWAKADKAAELRREAERRDWQQEHDLTGALRIDPTLPEAHATLAERYRAAHAASEQARQTAAADRAAQQLQSHAAALPKGHPVRQSSILYMKGDGALTLVTDPPGAEVLLHRYELQHRRLVPVPQRSLGRTPLTRKSLPMGSYLCVLRLPGRSDVHYPVHIERGGHWHGEPPGGRQAHPIWLPDTPSEDCYVPAGWFTAGGDAKAPGSLSRRRVWVDGLWMSRFPVTNQSYIEFLDDLVAKGRQDEAMRYAPQERGIGERKLAAQGYGYRQIYGYHDGRFSLRPDVDGDMWLPDWPVTMVDWHGAVAFAAWKAARSGLAWRLPHELEREKAARGVDGRFYPWGDGFDPSWCHMIDSHRGAPLPARVGEYPVDESVYGLRGMSGNTRDWTSTVFQIDSEVQDGTRLPPPQPILDPNAQIVLRGSGALESESYQRVAHRHQNVPRKRNGYLGIRLSRSIERLNA